MTARMTTDEALNLLDEVRTYRRDSDTADAAARASILIGAARIANDDTAVGDPDVVVNGDRNHDGLAARSLTSGDRMRWFSTLIEAVADVDRFVAWRARTADQHHTLSAALDACIATAVDRAAIAGAVLLYGLPAAEIPAERRAVYGPRTDELAAKVRNELLRMQDGGSAA